MPRTVVVERDWDTESVRSERPKKTTVRRYKVPDRPAYDDDRYETDIKITKRETERERPRDVRYEREVERERPVREYRVTRDFERAPSPPEPEYREWRVEREVAREAPRRAPYELERYTRDVEWLREPERPQEIIIRQEAPQPIIIRETVPAQEIVIREERREEPKLDIIDTRSVAADRRSEFDNRSMVRREPDPGPQSDDENYYYKRVTRQVRGRPDRQEDEYDDRDYEREPIPRRDVDPRDSVSNRGDDHYSDDGFYIKKTTEEWSGRDRSPNHRLHLAEGAAVGLAGAALLQNRKRRDGQNAGGAGQLAGGAALGAVGAELLTRARSRFRSRSREGRRYRSRSRSEPGISGVAKIGAVAALGALAAYAASRNNNNNAAKAGPNERRSRSRRRRSSVARGRSGSDASRNKDASDSSSRNATIAKAGLASAAVAGLVERVRSKSRGNRNRSLGRSALPVAAAGLGGAAIAGLYTHNKAAEEQGAKKRQSRRRSPSASSRARSRSRSVAHTDNQQNSNAGNQNLVVYGNDPIPPPDNFARPRSRADSLYGDGGNAGRDRGSPNSSRSSSPRRDRNSNRHRGERDESAGAAGLSGAAASGASERRQRKRQEREQRRLKERREDTPSNAGWGPYAEAAPVNAQYQYAPAPQFQSTANQSYYPQTNNFPPPPQNTYSPTPGPTYNHATYNQSEYSAPGANPGHAQQAGMTASTEGQWYPPAGQNHQYGGHYNVSRPSKASKSSARLDPSRVIATTADHPMLQRRKSVQFDLVPTEHHFDRQGTISNFDGDDWGCRTQGAPRGKSRSVSADSSLSRPQQHTRDVDRGKWGTRPLDSPDSNNSGETIQLPDRFDRDGRRITGHPADPLADQLEAILNGRGVAGKLFHKFAADLIGVGTSRR